MINPTVKDLIEELQKQDPDLPVVIYDPYNSRYKQFNSLKVVSQVDQVYRDEDNKYKQGEILFLHG